MPIRARSASHTRPPWAKIAVWFYFALILLLICISAFIWKSGEMLVRSDSLEHTPWAVVLAGEERDMERTEGVWNLFQEGRIDTLLLSGHRVFKTRYTSEFAAELLSNRGFPKEKLFQLQHEATSTGEEASVIISQARLLNLDTLTVITSNFHTARTRRIFKTLADGYPVILVKAIETPFFDPKSWWSYRISQRIWILEWLKTVHTTWEIFRKRNKAAVAEMVLVEPNPRIEMAAEIKPMPKELKDTVKTESLPRDTISVVKDSVVKEDSDVASTKTDSIQDTVMRLQSKVKVSDSTRKKSKLKEKSIKTK